MATPAVRSVLASTSKSDARLRVIGLYRAWWREVPSIVEKFTLDVGVVRCRQKLREMFERNRGVTDIRQIDMLVYKGKLELEETNKIWKQKTHVMRYFDNPTGPRPQKDFMTKFLEGSD
eukprot:m.334978 g.334978  ORF g.334978 m.334978 type:complete len:119 (+) comp17486_c0_seq1:37-393(+)